MFLSFLLSFSFMNKFFLLKKKKKKGVLYVWGPVQPANGPPTRTTSGEAGDPPTDLCP